MKKISFIILRGGFIGIFSGLNFLFFVLPDDVRLSLSDIFFKLFQRKRKQNQKNKILQVYNFIEQLMESAERGKDCLDDMVADETKRFPPEKANTIEMGELVRGNRKEHDVEAEKTKAKLHELTFSKDTLDRLQEQCDCKRHVKKLITIKPDLTKISTYRMSYRNQPTVPNIVNRSGQYSKLMGPHIALSSSYKRSFDGGKGDDLHRPKPENLLKAGGPTPKLTSYNSGLPGHHGLNQYIKPREKQIRGNFPLTSASTYEKQYPTKSSPKASSLKIDDSLKLNSPWVGTSSYERYYLQPNPQNYAKKIKITEKTKQQPNYSLQYETTYRKSFLMKSAKICPAKHTLETEMKGKFSSIKDKFAQNSDFKTLSPEYHSLSTSKHHFI